MTRPARAAAITAVLGLLLTLISAGAAYRADEATEKRLLETQSEQAAAVLDTAIFVIEQPLTTALQVQATAGPDGDPSVFRRTFAVNVGKDGALRLGFALASRRSGVHPARGRRSISRHRPRRTEVQELLGRAVKSKTSVVQRVVMGDQTRIAYALADPETGLVIKAERAIPQDRRASVDQNSAFSEHRLRHLPRQRHRGSTT